MKFIIFLLILLYAIYWGSTEGVNRYNANKIDKAIDSYYETTGYYPNSLNDLTPKYIEEIPLPPDGFEWELSDDKSEAVLVKTDDEKN